MDKAVEGKVFRDIDLWKEKIESYGEPQDDFERVRLHFICTQTYTTPAKRFVKNAAALIAMPFVYFFFCRCADSRKDKKRIVCDALVHAPFDFSTLKPEELPEELYEEFENIRFSGISKKSFRGGILDEKARAILKNLIKRYPLCFYMNFFVMYQLANLCKLLNIYRTSAIITEREENDPAITLLTQYCESCGAEYICIMHGEYFYEPFHAFMRLSRFYVWDEYYIQQFYKLKSSADFIVYHPKRFQMNIKRCAEPEFFVSYYLQTQSREEMLKIRQVLDEFIARGYKCKIRLHKRATDKRVVKEVFGDSEIVIEDNERVSIGESYENTKYIISVFSTVLSEAYENGLEPVIDDMSNPELYESLKKAMYINISRIEMRLSKLTEMCFGGDA